MKVQIVCATPENRDAGAEKLERAFPGAQRKRSSVVPAVIIGGATPLRDILKRYEGAAPYGGPDPATLWTLILPVSDRESDPQRMRDLTMSLCQSGDILDMEVAIHQDSDVAPDIRDETLEGDLHD